MNKNKEIINEIEIIFNNYKKLFKELENNIIIFKNNINKRINFNLEIINFYKKKKNESDINYQMKANIQNNYFNLNEINKKIKYNLNTQTNEINKLINLIKMNEIKNNIKKPEFDFKDFKLENMTNILTLKINQGSIYCIKTLDDGRIAAGDEKSNLIIYNKETFNPDIIIKNNLSYLINFIQLKNKNITCSFKKDFTMKIIKNLMKN